MNGRYTFGLIAVLSILLVVCLGSGTPAQSSPSRSPGPVGGGFPDILPDYDSGWQKIAKDDTLTLDHKLEGDTDDYVVDLRFMRSEGAHHLWYGTDMVRGERRGAYWYGLTDTQIKVYRGPDDIDVEQVRVRIWVVPEDDYHSKWLDLDPDPVDDEVTLEHGLGGDTDDYLVYLVARSTDVPAPGVHQVYYGLDGRRPGMSPDWWGFWWDELTTDNITVHIGLVDSATDLRVRIWRAPEADFDTDWLSLDPGDWKELEHGLHGPAHHFFVDLQFRSPGLAIHHRGYGLDHLRALDPVLNYEYGATWYDLSGGYISVRRESGEASIPELRLRIWAPNSLFLPLVLKNH